MKFIFLAMNLFVAIALPTVERTVYSDPREKFFSRFSLHARKTSDTQSN